jgi:hypothetical protein
MTTNVSERKKPPLKTALRGVPRIPVNLANKLITTYGKTVAWQHAGAMLNKAGSIDGRNLWFRTKQCIVGPRITGVR